MKSFDSVMYCIDSNITIRNNSYNLAKLKLSRALQYYNTDLECFNLLINKLQSFLWVSEKSATGIPYYTIKQPIDCKLYGWDSILHPTECENTFKWMVGEYNDYPEYNFYIGGNLDHNTFEYDYDFWGFPFARYRKRPIYC